MIKPSIPIYNKKDISQTMVEKPFSLRACGQFLIISSPLTTDEILLVYRKINTRKRSKINRKLFEKRRKELGLRSFFYVDIEEE